MKALKIFFRIFLLIVAVLITGFIGLLAYAKVTDFKPEEKEIIGRTENPSVLKDSLSISLLIWNIGYAGLDKNMDFFKDGGTKVITPKDRYLENIDGIGDFLLNNDTIDFILLQEVDRNSKRSYRGDQFEKIAGILAGYNPFFAKNYDVFFVPAPPSKPMGKVVSGIAVYSKYNPVSSIRYSLSGDIGFPTQLFYLDRCFMANRFKVENSKELVLINTHNEAFDEGGKIRKAQMERLREFVLNEYNSGNYVILGGDWNQYPPEFKPAFSANRVFTGKIGNFNLTGIESDYMPGKWKWIYDPATPSVRTLMTAYDPSTTPTSICDFFLISPNIEFVFVKCHQLDFTNSDHNPVIIRVKLR
ncbi:MAG TPA: hypothetical protein PKX27_07540 [Bacteroidales bacterium]|nr:hypothetical protein [Bacteroidales bacterium]HPM87818.1 hypothetical protein [Bacteroidales bacterium]HQM69997.1 hypothetical protein [Bacteroidales bacterium]